MNAKQKDREEAIAKLREILRPGDRIYTVLRHVSRSGMQRRIDLYKIEGPDRYDPEASVRYLSGYVARALGWRLHKQGGIVVDGCGMDMGFHLVYNLGATLWPQGTPEPHGTRNGEPDCTGGYALKHEWL